MIIANAAKILACCRSYPRSSAAKVNLPRAPEYLAAVHEKDQEAQASAAVLWEGLANSDAKSATFELSGHSHASGSSISTLCGALGDPPGEAPGVHPPHAFLYVWRWSDSYRDPPHQFGQVRRGDLNARYLSAGRSLAGRVADRDHRRIKSSATASRRPAARSLEERRIQPRLLSWTG
jgi:hypothetical protein